MPDIFDAAKDAPERSSSPKASVIPPTTTPHTQKTPTSDSFDSPEILETPESREAAALTISQTQEISALGGGTTDDQPPVRAKRVAKDVNEYSATMRHESASNNALKSFVPKPTRIFFASQHFEEKVLLLLRRHPVTQLGWIATAFLLLLVPFLFSAIGLLTFLPANYQFAGMVGWYLLVIGFSLESFLSWFYNVYIITDERVIDVDFYNLLYKNISSAKIDNIEDITTEAGGVLASVFNFGTVKIQTAGSVTEFEFEDVPQPAKVTAFLNELLLEEEREELEGRVN